MFGITRYIPSRERGLARRDPFFGEIDSIFNEFFNLETPSRFTGFSGVDIYEKDGALNMALEIPGIGPDKLEVKIFEERVSIRGKVEEEEKQEEEGKTWYSKRTSRTVNYDFALPVSIDAEKAVAKYEDGLLKITAPRRDKNGGGRVLSVER